MNGNKKEEQITIRLNTQMHNDLKKIAEAADRTLADFVRVHIKKIIEDDKALQKKIKKNRATG